MYAFYFHRGTYSRAKSTLSSKETISSLIKRATVKLNGEWKYRNCLFSRQRHDVILSKSNEFPVQKKKRKKNNILEHHQQKRENQVERIFRL